MAAILDPENLTGPQKTAIFLLSMGEEYSQKVFQRMNENEISEVGVEMSRIDHITPEMLKAVSSSFVDLFEGETKLIVEGENFLKKIISSTMDEDKASAVFDELEKRKQDLPFVWSKNINLSTLASYIEGEHPQTIAMILAHMPAEVASEIMMFVPDEMKGDIALRVARLGQISDDVVRDVDKALKHELSDAVGPGGKAGGLQVLVDIINGVDKSTEESVMEFIEEDSAEMANDIRNLMFVFEDMVNIDDTAMREVLKKVEGQQLTYALKTATDDMKEKIFSNLSQRAGEMLKDDIDAMGPIRLAEVEEAQQAVVRAAKELEADGTITLGKGKEDVLV
jgi:flagellar motor switch protein FliG